MLFKRIPFIVLISALFIMPLQAGEDVDLSIEEDDVFVWMENFFKPINEEVEETNVELAYKCGQCVVEIEDPEGPDWWPYEKKASCAEECRQHCMKKTMKKDIEKTFEEEEEFFEDTYY